MTIEEIEEFHRKFGDAWIELPGGAAIRWLAAIDLLRADKPEPIRAIGVQPERCPACGIGYGEHRVDCPLRLAEMKEQGLIP